MKQRPATAESTRDTGPLSLPPDAPAPIAAPRRPPRPAWLLAAALALVLLVAGGLLWTNLNNPANDQQPIAAVQGFVTALENRDTSGMLSYIEPTLQRREIVPELSSYVEYLERITIEDANYALLENDGQHALVRLTGTVDYQIREQGSATQQLDQTFELTKIEGAWYLAGVTLPPATP